MRALLIVDVQNDFLPGGALSVEGGDEVIAVINKLQKDFDIILATKDWHPSEHTSFATVHQKRIGEVIEVEGRRQELWPDHCVQKTEGADFSPLLKTQKIKAVFYKGIDISIDSYSAFYDNAHLRSTGLYEYLQEHEIDEVYIVGLATDYCVLFSALDAVKLGLKTKVVLEACRGIDLQEGDVERAIEQMKRVGVEVVYSLTSP